MKFSLLALVALLAACSAAPVSDDPSADAAASRSRVTANYTVPVPVELTDAASSTVDRVDWTVRNGVAKLKYDLPAVLVGNADGRVAMEGAFDVVTGTYKLSGDVGTAECTVGEGLRTSVSCHEVMPNLEVDLPGAQAAAVGGTADPGLAARRAEVARIFAHEPIGIVEFTIPSSR